MFSVKETQNYTLPVKRHIKIDGNVFMSNTIQYKNFNLIFFELHLIGMRLKKLWAKSPPVLDLVNNG